MTNENATRFRTILNKFMEADSKFRGSGTWKYKVVPGIIIEGLVLGITAVVNSSCDLYLPTISNKPQEPGNSSAETTPIPLSPTPAKRPDFTPTPFYDFKLLDKAEVIAGLPGPYEMFLNDPNVKSLFDHPDSISYSAWGIKDLNIDGTSVNYVFFRAQSKVDNKDYTAMVFRTSKGETAYSVLVPDENEQGIVGLALITDPETEQALAKPRWVFSSGLTREQLGNMTEEEYESRTISFVYPESIIEIPANQVDIKLATPSQNESSAAFDETDIAQSNRVEFDGKYMGLETNVAYYLSSSLSPNLTTLSIKDQSSALKFNFDTQFKRWSASHPGKTQQDYLDMLNNYQDGDDIPLTDIGYVVYMNNSQDGVPYEEGQEPYFVVPVPLHEDAPQEVDGKKVVGTNNFEYAIADDTKNVTTIDSSGTGYGINYDPLTNTITFIYCPPNGGNFAVKANATINVIRGLARWSWFMGRNTGSPFEGDQYPSASGDLEKDLKNAGLTVN